VAGTRLSGAFRKSRKTLRCTPAGMKSSLLSVNEDDQRYQRRTGAVVPASARSPSRIQDPLTQVRSFQAPVGKVEGVGAGATGKSPFRLSETQKRRGGRVETGHWSRTPDKKNQGKTGGNQTVRQEVAGGYLFLNEQRGLPVRNHFYRWSLRGTEVNL